MGIKLLISAGTRFGNLTVVGEGGRKVLPSGQTRRLLLCRCDCGEITTTHLDSLRRGLTKSCGCLVLGRHKEEAPIGGKFGRLTVLQEGSGNLQPSGRTARTVICVCECGSRTEVILDNLKSGNTQSCGCLHSEVTSEVSTTHGQTKGRAPTSNYRLWSGIKQRSVSGSSNKSAAYLGRGITMYAPWINDFVAFDTWITEVLGPRPEGCSLDRINNDGSYEPGNLRWATQEQQCNNTRRNRRITWDGETRTLAQWIRHLGISRSKMKYRLEKLGWTGEQALEYLTNCTKENTPC